MLKSMNNLTKTLLNTHHSTHSTYMVIWYQSVIECWQASLTVFSFTVELQLKSTALIDRLLCTCSATLLQHWLTISSTNNNNHCNDNCINSSIVCVCARVFTFMQLRGQIRARTWCCEGCGKLRGLISYFLATRSSQMNAEMANDVDPKY